MFKWARKRGHFDGDNPFTDQARREGDPRRREREGAAVRPHAAAVVLGGGQHPGGARNARVLLALARAGRADAVQARSSSSRDEAVQARWSPSLPMAVQARFNPSLPTAADSPSTVRTAASTGRIGVGPAEILNLNVLTAKNLPIKTPSVDFRLVFCANKKS